MASTLHYFFVHVALRDTVLDDPEYITQIFQAGPKNMLEYLKFLRGKILEKVPDLRNTDGEFDFELSLSEINENTKLLNIIMPPTSEPTEASVVGICFGEIIRYFTLEYGSNPITNADYHVFCEWSKEKTHLNYGMVNNPTPGVFAGKVSEIINK